MYKIILCSLFNLFLCYQTFSNTENIWCRTFPCGIFIYTGKLPILYYSRFTFSSGFLYLNFLMWTPVPLQRILSLQNLVSGIFSASIHFLQKNQPLLFSRFVFSTVSRLDATYVCAQNGKQAISHALYSSPVLAEFLRLLMLSQLCFDSV